MRLLWLLSILFVVNIGLTGCAGPESSESKATVEEINARDVEVDHADQPVLEFESK